MSSTNGWGLPARAMTQTGASSPSSILLLENGEIAGFGYWESGLFGANYTAASGLQAWVPMPMTLLKNTDGTPFISNVISIDAGENFFAFLKSDGTVWFIGGSITDKMEPLKQINVANVVSISASQSFLVLLTGDGKVYVRGQHRDVICYNSESGTNQDWDASLNLVKIGPLTNYRAPKVVKIAAGGNHFVMLDSNGYAWSAGFNDWGQLGVSGSRSPKGPQLFDIHRNLTDRYTSIDDYTLSDIWAGDRITVFSVKTAQFFGAYLFPRFSPKTLYVVGCVIPFRRGSETPAGDDWIKIPKSTDYRYKSTPERIWESPSSNPTFKVTIGGGIEGLSEDYRRMIYEEVSPTPRLLCVGFEGFERDLPLIGWQPLGNGDWTLKTHNLTSAKSDTIGAWGRYIGPFDIYYLDKVSGSVFTMASAQVMGAWSGLEAVDFTSYNVAWHTRLRPLVFRKRKTISSSAPLAGPYGFDVYDTKKRSILPEFGVLDAFTYDGHTPITRTYSDSVLLSELEAGRIRIIGYEFPIKDPASTDKPIQCAISVNLGYVTDTTVSCSGGNRSSRVVIVVKGSV